MGKVKGQGHIVGPTAYWLTKLLFHINQLSNSWDTAISQFDLESPRSIVEISGQKIVFSPQCDSLHW